MNIQSEIRAIDATALGDQVDKRLGDVELRPSRLLLVGPSGEVKLEPKGMILLILLADEDGRTVSREAFHATMWKGVFVGDDSLNRAVHIARRALRAVGSLVKIETVPRVGYRVDYQYPGPVPDDSVVEAEGPDVPVGPRLPRRALIGGAVIVGGLALGGISLQLRNRSAEAAELRSSALRALRSEASGMAPWAVAQLRQATALAPREAKNWGMLAFALGESAGVPGDTEEAREAADHALSLDPAESYGLLASVNLRADLVKWEETEASYRAIIAENPGHVEALSALGFLLQGVGRGDASWETLQQAIAADPLAASLQYKQAMKLWIAGNLAECDRIADRAMQLWPKHPWVWNARFTTYAFSGRQGAAHAMLADRDAHPEIIAAPAIATWEKGLDALELQSRAAIATARQAYVAAVPRAPGIGVHGVMTMAALGEVDAAFAMIDFLLFNSGPLAGPADTVTSAKLLSDAQWRKTQWLFTPPTGSVRADPRFPALAERIGLTDYWRRTGTRPDPVRPYA